MENRNEMYIPEERTARLLEIQFTVLPEDESIIGISDLGYFQGLGFSLPIPFNGEYFYLGQDPLLRSGLGDFEYTSLESDIVLKSSKEFEVTCDPLLSNDLELSNCPIIDSDNEEDIGIHPSTQLDDTLYEALETNSNTANLYAFLPGIFFCVSQNKSVDAVLVEVTRKELLGLELSSFRPEGVRSFDFDNALSLDDKGQICDVEINMNTIGKFSTGLSEKIAESLLGNMDTSGTLSMNSMSYTREIEIAECLSQMVSPRDLIRAYMSGAILTGHLMTLLHDIEQHGFLPRNRIYIRSSTYPQGKVIDVEYGTLKKILNLGSKSGIHCPEDVDLEVEFHRLSFAKLIGFGKEVDTEEAILDMYDLLNTKLGKHPTKNQVMELIFQVGLN